MPSFTFEPCTLRSAHLQMKISTQNFLLPFVFGSSSHKSNMSLVLVNLGETEMCLKIL